MYYGKEILGCLSEKQVVLDGKKLKVVSPHSKGNNGLYILNPWVSENRICIGQEWFDGTFIMPPNLVNNYQFSINSPPSQFYYRIG